ncbi:hypothetical protein [Protaetiibacter intestinalis]|uniref:ATP synthase n=1 Tax=Protaetiibacter intestinalis TaxID=2419774 RepID=A0A387B8U7_9MICO|nr:hypothetical protein [Protaetiibacter intestinalis]AYF98787.1 hypothetical protein D7I47_11360 [Protaetiibacter intestinalis]
MGANSGDAVQRGALRWGAVVAAVLAVLGSGIGWLVDGAPGLVGGALGAGIAFLFVGTTAASVLIASRVSRGNMLSPAYLGIVLGTWFLKLVIFVVLALWLRGQDWLNPTVFAIVAIVAVVASLVVDMVAAIRTRVPYVDVELPGPEATGDTDDAVR